MYHTSTFTLKVPRLAFMLCAKRGTEIISSLVLITMNTTTSVCKKWLSKWACFTNFLSPFYTPSFKALFYSIFRFGFSFFFLYGLECSYHFHNLILYGANSGPGSLSIHFWQALRYLENFDILLLQYNRSISYSRVDYLCGIYLHQFSQDYIEVFLNN